MKRAGSGNKQIARAVAFRLLLVLGAVLLLQPGRVLAADDVPVAATGVGSARAADLLAELRDPENQTWRRSERALLAEWSRSGSAAMDLLLERGREALGAGDTDQAIAHLSALIDHAPDFAEGWNARATAFFAAGDLGRSAADIARVLALNPDHFGALAGLGMIWTELDEPERALEAYRAALAIHPNKPELADAVDALDQQISGPEL